MYKLHLVYQSQSLTACLNFPDDRSEKARIVTFECVGGARDVATPKRIFGATLIKQFNVPMLHVIPHQDYWYQERDLSECLEALRPYLAENAFAYGSSMGAYAVARFADSLGLNRGLALSPRYSVDPILAPWSIAPYRKVNHITFRYDHNRPARKAKLFQLYDPLLKVERQHADLVAAEGPVQTVLIPGAGHPVGPALRECGLLKELVRAHLEDREDATAFQKLVDKRLPETSFALMQRADDLPEQEKLHLLAKALEMNPLNPTLRRRCAAALEKIGQDHGAQLMRATPRRAQDLPVLHATLIKAAAR